MNFIFGVSAEYGSYAIGLGLIGYGGFSSDWSFRWSTSGAVAEGRCR